MMALCSSYLPRQKKREECNNGNVGGAWERARSQGLKFEIVEVCRYMPMWGSKEVVLELGFINWGPKVKGVFQNWMYEWMPRWMNKWLNGWMIVYEKLFSVDFSFATFIRISIGPKCYNNLAALEQILI